MENLVSLFYEKYAATSTDSVRSFIDVIDWDNRFIGIKGSRGVGKTTLLLQYIKLNFKPDKRVLYVSLDQLYFLENKLYDVAASFYKKGGEFIAIDEVHKYEHWAVELKNIYDDMPQLKLVFTGSSLLHMHQAKADLSRRAVVYEMPGLSFREYIQFETKVALPRYSIDQITENHVSIAVDITQKIKPLHYFDDYLHHGYYPFYLENKNSFHQKLSEVMLTILEVDIPQYVSMPTSNINLLKKLMAIISSSVPFKPNMNSLSERSGISLNTMKNYVNYLKDAQLLSFLHVEEKGMNSLGKPDKIYMHNTNLMYNLVSNPDQGSMRETFFFNQVSQRNTVFASKQIDFIVNGHYSFEVGGRNKKQKQLKDLPHSYVVKDQTEIGSDNNIPLWLFGFLY
jgi:predicted AAA+ superfamily ATPase